MPVIINGKSQIVEVEEDVYKLITRPTAVQLITVGRQGPVGQTGAPGPASPGQTYIWDQSVSSTTWTIPHNLGQFPSVSTVDSAGTQIYGEVQYNSDNLITVYFTVQTGGKGFLN